MKKKTILATVLCALIMTGCGGNTEQPFVAGEDYPEEVEVDTEEVNAGENTEDVSAGEAEEEYPDAEDEGLESQMLTPGNISELAGTWYEADVLDARTLTISEDGSFSLEYRGGGTLYGNITIEEEETPDGEINYIYSFYDEGGDIWESLAIPDEGIGDDLYFGQGGEPHFVSEASLGIKAGADYVSSGGGATVDDFMGNWQCDRCGITISDVDGQIQVDIMWGDSADVTNCWQYRCTFDEATETLVNNGDGVMYILDSSSGEQEIKDGYTDGQATFTLNYGLLYWDEANETVEDEMGFEYSEVQD